MEGVRLDLNDKIKFTDIWAASLRGFSFLRNTRKTQEASFD